MVGLRLVICLVFESRRVVPLSMRYLRRTEFAAYVGFNGVHAVVRAADNKTYHVNSCKVRREIGICFRSETLTHPTTFLLRDRFCGEMVMFYRAGARFRKVAPFRIKDGWELRLKGGARQPKKHVKSGICKPGRRMYARSRLSTAQTGNLQLYIYFFMLGVAGYIKPSPQKRPLLTRCVYKRDSAKESLTRMRKFHKASSNWGCSEEEGEHRGELGLQ